MKSLAFSVFLFLVLALGCAGAAPAKNYSIEMRPMVRHSLVIQLQSNGVWHNFGSGVAISHGGQKHVLTARHVGEMIEGYSLRACATLQPDSCIDLNHERMYGKALVYNINDDWVKFEVDNYPKTTTSAKLAISKTHIGDSIWIVGAPSGQIGEVSHGVISNKKENLIFVDARVLPGNSGGPVYDRHGFLIGLAVALRGANQIGWVPTWGIVVPIQEIDW